MQHELGPHLFLCHLRHSNWGDPETAPVRGFKTMRLRQQLRTVKGQIHSLTGRSPIDWVRLVKRNKANGGLLLSAQLGTFGCPGPFEACPGE